MKVKVVQPVQVVHDGKRHTIGDVVEVPDEVAAAWIAQGWVSEVKPTKAAPRKARSGRPMSSARPVAATAGVFGSIQCATSAGRTDQSRVVPGRGGRLPAVRYGPHRRPISGAGLEVTVIGVRLAYSRVGVPVVAKIAGANL